MVVEEVAAGDDFVNGSSFFGFMGVTLALVLASNNHFMKIWELHMEQQRQELVSAVSLFGNHKLS